MRVMSKNPTKFKRPRKDATCHFKLTKLEKEGISRLAYIEDKRISSVVREAFFKVHPELEDVNLDTEPQDFTFKKY